MSKECKSSTSKRAQAVTGMVLAGGRGSRMGGVDKGLVELRDHLMIEWVVERLAPQVTQVFINANRNNDQYAELGYPIIADATADFRGPLAGIAAALASVLWASLLASLFQERDGQKRSQGEANRDARCKKQP